MIFSRRISRSLVRRSDSILPFFAGSNRPLSNYGLRRLDPDADLLHYEHDTTPVERRAERKSPAAILGEKQMPAISLPSELENKMERLFARESLIAVLHHSAGFGSRLSPLSFF